MNSQTFTPLFIYNALSQSPPSDSLGDFSFSEITTDSRKLTRGCLFVALKGATFDGHDFIEKAIAEGARGILCRKGFPVPSASEKIWSFQVEDPLIAYRHISAAWRKQFNIPVIAVAGSAGKTTTKELLTSLLKGKWVHVLKTEKSQNGFIGVPMTLLELRPQHEVAVIEIGIDEIGAMQQHLDLVHPTVAVLTSIGPEHLENLRDIPTVAREEGLVLSFVSEAGGITAINLDDPWIQPHVLSLKKGRRITFSLHPRGSSDHLAGSLSKDGRTLNFEGVGLKPTSISLPLPGRHNASNTLAAISIGAALGMTESEILKGLAHFKGAEGRSEVRELPDSTTVICDYYNAQPMSMAAGLDLLSQLSCNKKGNTWACLADMLELGPEEIQFHRELADKVLDSKVQNVLLYGPRMLALEDELRKKGYKGYLAHFANQKDLGTKLVEKIKPGDTLLIKGSRGMKMEEVWKLVECHIAK